MDYFFHRETFERLNSLYDEIVAISHGHCADLVDVRVAAASMAASFKRILEYDIVPLPSGNSVAHLQPDDSLDDQWLDDQWNAWRYPDEGKPISEWSIVPPDELAAPLDVIDLIDPSWFYTLDGRRYRPTHGSLQMAKTLIPDDECSSSSYAKYFQSKHNWYSGQHPWHSGQNQIDHDCWFCQSRKSCICEEAWSMNGETLRLHPTAWLDEGRMWQRHGLATIGELQIIRHPVHVCECPWQKCPVREAAGFAEWRNKFLISL